MTFIQARSANEVLKAQERRVRLQRMKGELVDRAKAVAQVFRLARDERDAWVNWPARVAAMIAAELEVDRTNCTRCSSATSMITSPNSPTSGRTCADRHHLETQLMLKALCHHPLMVGMAEVLVDAARYVAIVLLVLVLLGQLANIAL